MKHLRILASLGYPYTITNSQVEVRMKPVPRTTGGNRDP